MHSPDHIAEVLRSTLQCIEQNADVAPEHPDVRELKRILNEKIAVAEGGNTRITAKPIEPAA